MYMLDESKTDRVFRLIEESSPSLASFARDIGVIPQVVNNWKKRGIPASRLHSIAAWLSQRLGREITVESLHSGQPATRSNPKYAEHVSSLSAGVFEPGPPLYYSTEIPIVGTTQAGPDRHWIEEGYPAGFGEEYIDMPSKDPQAYGLRVRGGSMHPRFKDGEVVGVSPNTEPMPGDEVIIVTTGGEVMVKELVYMRNDEVALESVADGYPRQTLPLDQIELMHTVTGGIRASSIRKR